MTHKAKTHNRPSPPVERLIEGLSSRYLLFGLGAIFVLDLFTPDLLPFIDEIVLGISTLLLARWQSRRRQTTATSQDHTAKPPPKNVTPGATAS